MLYGRVWQWFSFVAKGSVDESPSGPGSFEPFGELFVVESRGCHECILLCPGGIWIGGVSSEPIVEVVHGRRGQRLGSSGGPRWQTFVDRLYTEFRLGRQCLLLDKLCCRQQYAV